MDIRHVESTRARTADGHARLYVDGGGIGLGVAAARFASEKYPLLPGRPATSLPPCVPWPGLSLSMFIWNSGLMNAVSLSLVGSAGVDPRPPRTPKRQEKFR